MTIEVNYNEIPEEFREAKRWWRRTIRKALAELPEAYRNDASIRITHSLRRTEAWKNAETVMLYASAGKEVITSYLLNMALREGKKVCLPKCLDIDADGKKNGLPHEMNAREFGTGYRLVSGAYGIPEPHPDAPVVPAEAIDLIVLPCMGCSVKRERLGHGAGYYDRFLETVREDCGKIALCYERILAEELPTEEHDVPMDAVITEKQVYCE